MDPIKEAFSKAKQDIQELRAQLAEISFQLEEIKRTLRQTNQPTDKPTLQQTHPTLEPTDSPPIPTQNKPSFPKMPLYDLKSPNTDFSTGNRGVPTDRQTNPEPSSNPLSSRFYLSPTRSLNHACFFRYPQTRSPTSNQASDKTRNVHLCNALST